MLPDTREARPVLAPSIKKRSLSCWNSASVSGVPVDMLGILTCRRGLLCFARPANSRIDHVSRNPPSERPVALFNVSGRIRNLLLLDWLNPGPPARRARIP